MKICRILYRKEIRKFVKEIETFCAKYFPRIHTKIFLPMKAFIKVSLLKLSMTGYKKISREFKEWKLVKDKTFLPLVSVVVPNYNHAEFLIQRLESIYNQSYKNFEVILLDDASNDSSRKILKSFYESHKFNTRFFFNETNSGKIFSQWQKGIELSRGDLIWIAESDDFSDKNFLSELVPAFADTTIQLAFCRSEFIQDNKKTFSTEQYLSDISVFDWKKEFSVTAANFVAYGLAIKNLIPNVSSVIFRRCKFFRADFLKLWSDMKLCGDWLFYLEIIKGGCVYYSPNTTNFYRVHKSSTSLAIQKETCYFHEHEKLAEFVAENYSVTPKIHEIHFKELENHFEGYYGGEDINKLKTLFNLKKIDKIKRKPNILMGIFSMNVGGGEIFPLVLAEELFQRGFPITILNFQLSEDLAEIKKNLNSSIPLIQINKTEGLTDIIEQFKIDIIHTHHAAVDIAVSYAKEIGLNFRHIVTLHGMYEAIDKNYLKKVLSRVKKSVDTFVYVADKNLLPFRMSNFGRENIFYKIGNGLKYSPINPIKRSSINISENSFVACIASRAIPQKGWQAAIDAVEFANKFEGRRIELILIGAGEMYEKLNGHVGRFIHLVGFKRNVRDYFAAADVGLLPSEYTGESFPLMIIDSFFAGRPIISSNIGEAANMIQDAGVVFNLVDEKVPVEQLAKILRKLANDAGYYQKLKDNVERVSKKFSIEAVAEEYISLYERDST